MVIQLNFFSAAGGDDPEGFGCAGLISDLYQGAELDFCILGEIDDFHGPEGGQGGAHVLYPLGLASCEVGIFEGKGFVFAAGFVFFIGGHGCGFAGCGFEGFGLFAEVGEAAVIEVFFVHEC